MRLNLIRNYFLDTDRVKTLLLFLIVATIPLKINLGNVAIIIAVLYNLLFFSKINLKKLKSFTVFFPVLFFIISVISGLASKDYYKGIAQLDRQLLLILVTLILININLSKKIVDKILKVFFYSSVVCTILLLINLLIKVFSGESLDQFIFHNFTSLYDQHPVYFSLYLSLSLFYAIDKLTRRHYKKRYILIYSIPILILGLVFCASKAVIFIDILMLFFYLFANTKNIKRKILYIGVLASIIICIFNVSFLKERFVVGLAFNDKIASFEPTNNFKRKKIFSYEDKSGISDLELRWLFLKIGLYHIIEDDKLYFGYGQGDNQNYLDYYLFTYNLGPNWFEGFNVHNQYLYLIMNYGIFVFLCFMAYLYLSFRTAIGNNDFIHLFFLLSICFVFIFEVSLIRNKGIIYFYFFNTLFLLKTEQD